MKKKIEIKRCIWCHKPIRAWNKSNMCYACSQNKVRREKVKKMMEKK